MLRVLLIYKVKFIPKRWERSQALIIRGRPQRVHLLIEDKEPPKVPMHWAIPLYGYVMPVIVMLTLATNSFIVIVLSHKYLRTPTNYVLLAMAVSELLTGLCVMPWFMYYFTLSGRDRILREETNHGTTILLASGLLRLSAILTGVQDPQAGFYIVYPRWPDLVIFLICIAAVLMYIPDVLAFENLSLDVMDYRKNATRRMCYRRQTWLPRAMGLDLFYNLTFCAQTVFVHLIPCAMLVVFTWKLVRAIQLADKRHASLLSKSARRKFSEPPSSESLMPERNYSKNMKPRESVSEPKRAQGLKQNTRMLIVVIVLFLVTEIPAALIFIIHVLSVSLKSYVINYQLLNVLLIVRNVLIVISYPFRFAIYCGMSQQFRDVVRQMFTGKLLPRIVHDKDNSTTMALVQTTTDRESDEKRNSSVILCSNGTMPTSLSAFPIKSIVKISEKGIQCGRSALNTPISLDSCTTNLNSDHNETSERPHHKSTSRCDYCDRSTQCDAHLDLWTSERKDSIIRSHSKEKAVVCQAMFSRIV
ncbi:7 transmembrane receptor [Ancylostoma ceylanicum]|uniref:7 transmembrane receptor n=1 Tax=Ancylostoma ceylanicum TaxID=53326 RepID=A0A0D6M9N7_9BILA|nr:7 transmembrane receptor [Ancylostoma ceylanicum]